MENDEGGRVGRSVYSNFFLTKMFVEHEWPEREKRGQKGIEGKPVIPLIGSPQLCQLGNID